MVPEGSRVEIVEIRAGRKAMRRLSDLGFLAGSIIRVLKSFSSGPILLEVRGSRIALGRGIAMKVLVEVLRG